MSILDRGRWVALCARIGVDHAPERFDTLSQAYAGPGRHYHTDGHIVDCLAIFDETVSAATHRDEVEFALWLHDIVYEPLHGDNEERSAEIAAAWLVVDPSVAGRVRGLILATRHDAPPSTGDEALIQDVDLHILAADAARFDRYEADVRREYGGVPDAAFRKGRREILAQFLRREHLFNTPWFRSRCEAQARANLERSLSRL